MLHMADSRDTHHSWDVRMHALWIALTVLEADSIICASLMLIRYQREKTVAVRLNCKLRSTIAKHMYHASIHCKS